MGVCNAEENVEIFSKDIAQQKENINKDFERIDSVLSLAKLQKVRSGVDVLEYKIGKIKKKLTKQEQDTYRHSVDKIKEMVVVKEDSLISKAFELMRTKGVEASLQYTQNNLRNHGVTEKKINAAEKKILKDAPAIQQAFERDEIAKVTKIIEAGALPDSTTNPYILKTAQMIVKAKTDSIQRIERAQKLKEMEAQERADRARMQQAMQEMKEKKKEEELLSKRRREEERISFLKENARKRAEMDQMDSERIASSENEIRGTEDSATEIMQKELKDSLQPPVEEEENGEEEKEAKVQKSYSHPGARQTEPGLALSEQTESKSVQIYLQHLKKYQQSAQEKVMELYNLLEKNKGREALKNFKKNRGFIAQYVDAQVFTILEQTIMQSVIELNSLNSLKRVGAENGRSVSASHVKIPVEQQHLNRINGFLRDNKVEAAYAEFKRREKQLKKIMTKSEFKQFKKMIENAYKTRNSKK